MQFLRKAFGGWTATLVENAVLKLEELFIDKSPHYKKVLKISPHVSQLKAGNPSVCVYIYWKYVFFYLNVLSKIIKLEKPTIISDI